MKKILPIILGLVLIGGGYFAYTMFLAGGPAPEPPAVAQKKLKVEQAASKKTRLKNRIEGPIASLGDSFVVNLSDPNLGAFAKADISLKVDAETPFEAKTAESTSSAPVLEENTQIRDLVIDVLGSYSSAELGTAEGRQKMKNDLMATINKTTAKTVCLDVYFTFFAIQAQPAG
jgi:flagellar basal body-associated protein FliL